MNSFEPSLDAVDTLKDIDALCVFVADDDRPLTGAAGYLDWRMCGSLSRVLLQGFFKGDRGEQLLMPTSGGVPAVKLFAVGAGPSKSLDASTLGLLLESSALMLKRAGVQSVAVSLPKCGLDDAAKAEAVKKRFVPSFSPGTTALFAEKALRALL
ncbi:MAG: peptidase M17 [Myxococcaceae bacterium]|nr:peptidase M17 [Myxococcaceae bacterium]